jgi:hypothetical protein
MLIFIHKTRGRLTIGPHAAEVDELSGSKRDELGQDEVGFFNVAVREACRMEACQCAGDGLQQKYNLAGTPTPAGLGAALADEFLSAAAPQQSARK